MKRTLNVALLVASVGLNIALAMTLMKDDAGSSEDGSRTAQAAIEPVAADLQEPESNEIGIVAPAPPETPTDGDPVATVAPLPPSPTAAQVLTRMIEDGFPDPLLWRAWSQLKNEGTENERIAWLLSVGQQSRRWKLSAAGDPVAREAMGLAMGEWNRSTYDAMIREMSAEEKVEFDDSYLGVLLRNGGGISE